MWERLERREIKQRAPQAGTDGVPSWNMPPLTRRDAAAESPLDALDLDAAPAFLTPPDLPKPTLRWGSWTP